MYCRVNDTFVSSLQEKDVNMSKRGVGKKDTRRRKNGGKKVT